MSAAARIVAQKRAPRANEAPATTVDRVRLDVAANWRPLTSSSHNGSDNVPLVTER
jgi:hypothetical protein